MEILKRLFSAASRPRAEPSPEVVKWIDEILKDEGAYQWLSTDDEDLLKGLSTSDGEFVVERIVKRLQTPLQYWELVICHHIIEVLGSKAAPAVPVLVPFLTHSSEAWRRSTANALGDIGPWANRALPALRQCLDDAADSVRSAAEDALSRIKS